MIIKNMIFGMFEIFGKYLLIHQTRDLVCCEAEYEGDTGDTNITDEI